MHPVLAFLDGVFILLLAAISPFVALFRLVFLRGQISDADSKTVLITGCGSGFGLHAAEMLAGRGVTVFAGCRREESVQELKDKNIPHLHPIQLDVSQQDSVEQAVRSLAQITGKQGLWALVNNAGVEHVGRAEWLPMEDYERSLEVILTGSIRTTQLCLPLLKQARGRVVTVLSLLSWAESADISPYATSKFALNGFMRCLRHEVAQYGVRVITVSPGFYATKLSAADQSFERAFRHAPLAVQSQYPKEYLKRKTGFFRKTLGMLTAGKSMESVLRAYEQAVLDSHPQDEYWVGLDMQLTRLINCLPSSVVHMHNVVTRGWLGGDPDYDSVSFFT